VASVLNDLAGAERLSGDYDGAERDYREGLGVARAISFSEGVAAASANLVALALDRKDWPGAEALAREALSLSEPVGNLAVIAITCRRLARALVRQGKRAEALPYARRAVEIYTRLGLPGLELARTTLEDCEG
jgi:tetratricopeptide (TPR) repeat protein